MAISLPDTFSNIAQSIRALTGIGGAITPLNMPGAINNFANNIISQETVSYESGNIFAINTEVSSNVYVKQFTQTVTKLPDTYESGKGYFGAVFNGSTSSRLAGYTNGICIGNNITAVFNFLANPIPEFQDFNQPIIFATPVNTQLNVGNFIVNVPGYNQPLSIPAGVNVMGTLINSLPNYNSPITLSGVNTINAALAVNCANFNQPLDVPQGTKTITGLVRDCPSFNQRLTIPDSVVNLGALVVNCVNFNYPIVIPGSVQSVGNGVPYAMIDSIAAFNQPLILDNGIVSVERLYNNCSNFNIPITLPESVTELGLLVAHCVNYNSPITLSPGLVNITNAVVDDCPNFDQSISLPSTLVNFNALIANSPTYNTPLNLLDSSVTSITSLISDCPMFNAEIVLPRVLVNINGTFNPAIWTVNGGLVRNCNNFNLPIDLSACTGLTIVNGLVTNCELFNQSVTFPDGVKSLTPFYGCNNFNYPIVMPSSVENALYMVCNCHNFNAPITLSPNLTNAYAMVRNTNFNRPVNLLECPNLTSITGMFANTRFNQPLTIPDKVSFAGSVVRNCPDFNCPVRWTTPASLVVSAVATFFNGCPNFNQPIVAGEILPLNYQVASGTFSGCVNLNQLLDLRVSDSCMDFSEIFLNCRKIGGVIHIPGCAYVHFGTTTMISIPAMTNAFQGAGYEPASGAHLNIYMEPAKRVTNGEIYCPWTPSHIAANMSGLLSKPAEESEHAYYDLHIHPTFTTNIKAVTNARSIVGEPVTWTDMPDGNGFYNSEFHINVYNNYIPAA